MAFGMEVGLGPGDCVFNGDQAAPRTGGTPTTTQFLAHVYCGQTAGWIKMSVGTEVGLGPGDIVLDSKPALPPRKGGVAHDSRPIIGSYLSRANGWMDQDATWYVGRSRPR